MKIGFFDSGLGGILILKAVAEKLPQYDYEYYGDTANVPYGDKSEAHIYELTKAGVQHLFDRNCLLVVIACNTASAESLYRLQHEWLPESYPDRKILGVIIPMVEAVLECDSKRLLLIGTRRTISSGKYHLEFGKRNELNKKIEAEATPQLVPLIENNQLTEAGAKIKELIGNRVVAGEIDGIILGCTHYCLLKENLREVHGSDFKVFSQDEIIPTKLKIYLEQHTELTEKLAKTNYRNVYLTAHRGDYDEVLKNFLGGHFIGG